MRPPDYDKLREHLALRPPKPVAIDRETALSSIRFQLLLPEWRLEQFFLGVEHTRPELQHVSERVFEMLDRGTLDEDPIAVGALCSFALGNHADVLVAALGFELAAKALHHAFGFHWVEGPGGAYLELRREENPFPPFPSQQVVQLFATLSPTEQDRIAHQVRLWNPEDPERGFWSEVLGPDYFPTPVSVALRALETSTVETLEDNLRACAELGLEKLVDDVLVRCIDRLGIAPVASACERALARGPASLIGSVYLAFQWVGSVEAARALLALRDRASPDDLGLLAQYEELWPAYMAAAKGVAWLEQPLRMPEAPFEWEVVEGDLWVHHPSLPLPITGPRGGEGLLPGQLSCLDAIVARWADIARLLGESGPRTHWIRLYVHRKNPWCVGVAGTSEHEVEHGVGVVIALDPHADGAPRVLHIGPHSMVFQAWDEAVP